jgi:hypothetical protein
MTTALVHENNTNEVYDKPKCVRTQLPSSLVTTSHVLTH